MDRINSLSRGKRILIAVTGIILSAGFIYSAFNLFKRGPEVNAYNYITAEKGTLIEKVEADGTTKAAQDVKLAFEVSGKIAQVNFKSGDPVKAGDIIIELDSKDYSSELAQANASVQLAASQLKQAEAALEMQKIKKDELVRGARQEEINVSAISLENAEKSLENAEKSLAAAVNAASTKLANAEKTVSDAEQALKNTREKADIDLSNLYRSISTALDDVYAKNYDAVIAQTNQMFDNAMADPKLKFDTPLMGAAKTSAESKRSLANSALSDMRIDIDALNNDSSNYQQIFNKIYLDTAVIRDFLNSMNLALNSTVVSTEISQTTINTYRAYVNAGISEINLAEKTLKSLDQSIAAQKALNNNLIDAAQTAYDQAQNALKLTEAANTSETTAAQARVTEAENLVNSLKGQYDLKTAKATADQLASQDAAIKQAQASVYSAQAGVSSARASREKIMALVEKTKLRAPADGTVNKLDISAGELVSPGQSVAEFISSAKFQAEVFFPETEIAKIKPGDQAQAKTIGENEAFLPAKVIAVDRAATIINGAPVYKVVLEFSEDNADLQTGKTINAEITVAELADVVIVPESAVIKNEYSSYVIVSNGTAEGEKREVEVGPHSQDGQIAILAGLASGEEVAVFGSY